ncbi:prephenate dehydratase [Sulfurovum sp. bin170]|uniref:prephenate dehydratase domain-containing protein n=1 Tax=Sulfurovum sp. bin170 TaxID=2695268 RepID=UPI0013DFBEE5|nr:prephenate dehydratase domain-containing protein [Sulfurovum sp. bin170]NEW60746.1 prephenate dehydratase [Sulfurovum sp. bin170]
MSKRVKVSYQGIAGAYSHLACYGYFGEEIECLENETFEDAMEQVEEGKSDFAMIPIENKTAGRVDEFYGLIPEMKLQIVGEHYQKIEHCLMGLEDSLLENIQYAYSHPQGLAQCRNTLKALNIRATAQFDTAGSAKEIKERGSIYLSAIASSLAAKTYGLKILKENVQDQKNNFTRFIVLSNSKKREIKKQREYITSIIFEVRNIPSALYQALGGFAKNRVNILKIESYIPLGRLKESHFHIDVDGSLECCDLQKALEELNLYVKKIKIIGSYEKSQLRIIEDEAFTPCVKI